MLDSSRINQRLSAEVYIVLVMVQYSFGLRTVEFLTWTQLECVVFFYVVFHIHVGSVFYRLVCCILDADNNA